VPVSRGTLPIAVLAAMLETMIGAPASAQCVASAVERFQSADFDGAHDELRRCLAAGDIGRADALEAYRHLAAIALVRGDRPGAEAYARSAIALDPATSAPEGAPELLREILDTLRARVERATLRIEHYLAQGEVVLALEGDARELLPQLALECASQPSAAPTPWSRSAHGPPPLVRLAIGDTHAALRCRGTARSRGGAAWLLAETEVAAREPPASGDGWLWAIAIGSGVVVIGAIVGVTLGFVLGGDQSTATGTVVVDWP
jgi:hypothetical protein